MKKNFRKIAAALIFACIISRAFCQEEYEQIKILDRGFMQSPNMYVSLRAPEGWIVDEDFARWGGELIGFLPLTAYKADGVDITFYILGHLEEGAPKTYKEFLKIDENNYKRQGVKPKYKNVKIKLDNADGILDYGLCEIYGLPNSKVEMMFVAETAYGNIVLFFAAKGSPDDDRTDAAKNKFIEACKSVIVYDISKQNIISDEP